MINKNMSHIQTIKSILLVLIGIALIIFGITNSFFLRDILQFYNRKLLTISPSMRFYKEWKDTPTHILNKVYLFNFTNPADFKRNGTKPVLNELGPYTFKEYQRKVNITWNLNSTVTYRVHREWYFEPEMSNGTLDDNITTISAVPMFAANKIKDRGFFIQKLISMALSGAGENLEITKTANVFLFKGYDYPFSMVGTHWEPTMKKMGYLHTFNDSSLRDGTLNVDTGESDIKKVGKVKNWNFTPYQLQAGLITGTTGELFSSELQKTNITLFTPWLCKDLHFDFVGEELVNGIKGYKFVMSKRNIDNGSEYEENLIAWPDEIFPSGIVNLSLCYYDGLVIASYPHFYMADPYFASKIDGIKSDPETYESYYIIEPMTGAPLKGRLSGQVNYLLRRTKYFRFYQNIPPVTIFPIVWVQKSFELPEHMMMFLRTYLFVIEIFESSALPSLIVGICILLYTILWKNMEIRRIAPCLRWDILRRKKKGRRKYSTGFSTESERNEYVFTKLSQKLCVAGNGVKVDVSNNKSGNVS